MRDWIMRSWFRHPLSLRPFVSLRRRWKGVGLGGYVMSTWDEGWHANEPLRVQLLLLKWILAFGIKDSN